MNALAVEFQEQMEEFGWHESEDSSDDKLIEPELSLEAAHIRYAIIVWGMSNAALEHATDQVKVNTELRAVKVALYARLVAREAYAADSPLVKAVNALLPGDIIEADDSDTITALYAERKSMLADNERAARITASVNEAYNATDINIYEDRENTEIMMDSVEKITHLVLISSVGKNPDDVSWQAQRESIIRETAVEFGLKSVYTDQLVKHFTTFILE